MTEVEDTGNEVPVEVEAQLRAAVDTAINSPKTAQGFLGLPTPDLGALGEYKGKAIEIIDKVLAAIDTIQQYSWLIPSKYVDGVQGFEDALRKVRGWLD
jgi:hypothetical protein